MRHRCALWQQLPGVGQDVWTTTLSTRMLAVPQAPATFSMVSGDMGSREALCPATAAWSTMGSRGSLPSSCSVLTVLSRVLVW